MAAPGVTIAVDAMSGDRGCEPVVRAAKQAVAENRALGIILLGDRGVLEKLLVQSGERIQIIDAPQVVTMDERPSHALRHKQSSSMAMALRLVSEGGADACVSAGNTGALMALGRSILRTYPGIERPAIIKRVPSFNKPTYVLDLGANVDAGAENLVQYALMGTSMVRAIEGIESPRVALLNVGEEEVKGNEQVRLAAHMLSTQGIVHYIGYIEGDDLFRGVAEVVVCDGFVGNIAIKTGEGVAQLLKDLMKQVFRRSWYGRAMGLLVAPLFGGINRRMDPSLQNGASFIGLQGVVIKSHGSADTRGLVAAMREAVSEVEQRVPQRLSKALEQIDF